jgi:hypothetical protein
MRRPLRVDASLSSAKGESKYSAPVRAKTIVAFLAATAIVGACALPASGAAAGPHRYKQKASVSTEIELRGTHKFRLSLLLFDRPAVILDVSKGAPFGESVSIDYSSFARHPRSGLDGSRLNVRIGRLGHFRGHFVPTSTESKKLAPECKGDPTEVEKGYFVGSFYFRGAAAYTEVHAHRARGTVTRQSAGVCEVSPGRWHESKREVRERKEGERHEFHLVAADEKGDVLFQARREDSTRKSDPVESSFQASASVNGGKVGDFSVSYLAFLFGLEGELAAGLGLEGEPAADFQVPNLAEPLAEATIAPPAPFSGSATFHLEDPKTATWTGDLAVELPGIGKVPLTGEGIAAGLCNGPPHCTKTLPKFLQPVLEAASNEIVAVSVPKPKRDR